MRPPSPLEPHHDGSPLYLDDPEPALGSEVEVRVWVPHAPDGSPSAKHVVLRSVRDGEPRLVEAVQDTVDGAGAWWRAPLQVRNPVTSYRFLVGGGDGGYRWLNGSGVHARDVTDAADFRLSTEHHLPDWVRDQVGYQVFPDRFSSSGRLASPGWAHLAGWDDPVVHRGPGVEAQLYGGTLDGVAERLAHLTGLGANLLYLTPIFEGRSNHRYDAVSFDRVDPVLGGDEAFDTLVRAAHDAGVRVMGDITTNHTGVGHEWFRTAVEDPASLERGFYRFRDGEYESWLDVPSLPKLDHASPELRRRLYEGADSVLARWLARGLDGWRVDVANMTARMGADDATHEVARIIRATMREGSEAAWLLAEHGHDASLDLAGDGWHGTMDYSGFTRPLWCWLNGGSPHGPGVPHGLGYLGLPVDIPVLDARAAVTTMREVHAAMPWASWAGSTSHLDSHDTPRFRTVTGGGTDGWVDATGHGRDRHLVGLALQMTMPGVPVVFMGDEIGLTAVDGEHARTPFPWHREDEWDLPTLDAYRTWIRLRRDHVALRRGSMRWLHVGADSVTFLREHPEQRILVHAARGDHPSVELPMHALNLRTPGQVTTLVGEEPALSRPGHLALPARGTHAHVYALG